MHCAEQNHYVRCVVSDRAQNREKRAHHPAPYRKVPILFVESLRQRGVALRYPRGQPEHLHFFRRLVARAYVAEIIKLAPLRSPAKKQRVAQRREVSFPQEARYHGDREKQEEPRTVRDQRSSERQQRECVLGHGEQQRQEGDSADGLSSRALEVIVELGILELREIEPRGVLHQPDAHRVGKQITEQALDQRRRAGEDLADQHDAELEREVAPHLAQASVPALRRYDRVEYQLSDPERSYRDH